MSMKENQSPSSTVFRASPNTLVKNFDDNITLLHMKTKRFFVLNATGTRLWQLAAAGVSRSDIQRQLLKEFDVNETQLSEEIDRLLTSLQNEDLLEPA